MLSSLRVPPRGDRTLPTHTRRGKNTLQGRILRMDQVMQDPRQAAEMVRVLQEHCVQVRRYSPIVSPQCTCPPLYRPPSGMCACAACSRQRRPTAARGDRILTPPPSHQARTAFEQNPNDYQALAKWGEVIFTSSPSPHPTPPHPSRIQEKMPLMPPHTRLRPASQARNPSPPCSAGASRAVDAQARRRGDAAHHAVHR